MSIVAVDELALAYRAALRGDFRNGASAPVQTAPVASAPEWTPQAAEAVVLVTAAHPAAGASTVALTLATCAGEARVVECCTVASSGLAGAAGAELGVTRDGWVQGSRDGVLIERRGDRVPNLAELPPPGSTSKPVTVIDSSWDIDLLMSGTGWLSKLAQRSPMVILVARATNPGLRRLEAAISVVGEQRALPVLIGAGKRWPKHIERATGPALRRLRDSGRVAAVPDAPQLAGDGLTPDPLPAALLNPISHLLDDVKGLP